MVVAGALRLTGTAVGTTLGAGKGRGGGAGAVEVSQVIAQPRTFADQIEVLGLAKGRQSVTITSNNTELITAVHFKDGQHVGQGQVLVDLKAQEQDAQIAQAQATLNLATVDYERWQTLADKGIAPKATADQYKAAYEQAKANVAAARSRKLDRVIRAPFAGVVGLSDVAPGTLINPGAAIASLDDVSTIRVDFTIPDRYLPVLREGLPITAHSDAYPNDAIHGRIAKLDTRVDDKTRSIKARAEFPNRDGKLKPGLLMRVAISQGERHAVAAPEAAVQYQGNQASVFLIVPRDGKLTALQQPVTTGVDEGGFIEIKDGLQAGAAIVADGLNRVRSNQQVRLAGEGGRHGGGGRHMQSPR